MLREISKAMVWFVAGILGLGVLVYLTALAVNRHDSEPSAAAARFANLYRNRPTVADDDNAYLYLLGFEAPQGSDPRTVGAQRIAWMRRAATRSPFDTSGDPLQEPLLWTRPSGAQELVERCGTSPSGCVAAFNASAPAFGEWIAADGLLLERYRTLIALAGWQDLSQTSPAPPLPAYAAARDGQALLLLTAKDLAERGDTAGVRAALSSDLRFWRTVYESADTLIAKMIATSALQRHFEWSSLVLRELAPGTEAAAIPAEWQSPITDSERSMVRALAGELAYVSASLRGVASALRDPTAETRTLSNQLAAPLFQPQATANAFADYYWAVNQTLEAPFERYDAATRETTRLAELTARDTRRPRTLYNITGAWLAAAGRVDVGEYARRAADVEGTRRAALAGVALRDARVERAEVADALRASASALRNPYDGEPLQWDERDGAIVFRGLEPGERGIHRIYF